MAFGDSDREWRRRLREEQRTRDEEARERRHREHLEAIERNRQEAENRHYENRVERELERERRRIERDARERERYWVEPSAPAPAAAPKPTEAPKQAKNSGGRAGAAVVAALVALYAGAKLAEASSHRPPRRDSDMPDFHCVSAPPRPKAASQKAVIPEAKRRGWTARDSILLGAAGGVMFWIGMRLAELLI